MGIMSNDINKKKAIWADYWHSYGGLKALCISPYLWLSLVGAVCVLPLAYPSLTCSSETPTWYSLALDVIPSILGFTLAGYTIFLSFGDTEFVASLMGTCKYNQKLSSTSPYKRINASLVHFIIVQVCSLIAAICGYAWRMLDSVPAFIGLWAFTYSIATALATTMAMFRLARMLERATLNKISETQHKDERNSEPS